LFQAAIAESGLCASKIEEPTLAVAEAAGAKVAEKLGCTGAGAAACLRAKSQDELLAATEITPPNMQPPGGPFYVGGENVLSTIPNVDGVVMRRSLRTAFTQGVFEPRPLILGTNKDEGTLFHSAFFAMEVTTETEYREALARRFGAANVDAIVARYPIASFKSANAAIAEVTGDAFFVCPARTAARGAAGIPGAAVYLYSFDHMPESTFLPDLGVFHSVEIPYLFGTDGLYPLARVGERGAPVAAKLQQLWIDFAKTGSPGSEWPKYGDADQYLSIDDPVSVKTALKASQCEFWDQLPLP
jgi:para-nitrobenzyl esterase